MPDSLREAYEAWKIVKDKASDELQALLKQNEGQLERLQELFGSGTEEAQQKLEEMASKGAGGIHYWFFPTLAFGWSLLWCFQSRTAVLKTVSGALLCLMCLGIVLGWRYPAFKDMHFAEHAQRFNKAPVGTEITIPENPEGWSIRLVKRQLNQ